MRFPFFRNAEYSNSPEFPLTVHLFMGKSRTKFPGERLLCLYKASFSFLAALGFLFAIKLISEAPTADSRGTDCDSLSEH